MKILHVISMGHVAGGAEKSVVMMRDELMRRGHEVKIFASDTPGDQPFSDYTFRTINPDSPLKSLHHLFYIEAYRQLKAAIADFRPDVVHFHTLTSCSPSVLFATGRTPAVLTIHGPEEFTTELLPWFLSPNDYRTKPFDLSDLTPVGRARYWYYQLVQRPLYRLGFRHLSVVVAPSRYIQAATAKDFAGTRVEQIYNGIALPTTQDLPKQGPLLFVGRLETVKGVKVLLRAFQQVLKQLPNARLRIVGDGPQRHEFEELAATLGVGANVTFAGWVAASDIPAEYAASQGLVIPSIWPENLPTVCIEAMGVGRPVIGTDTGGIPELIRDNQTGYIVPVGDDQALAKAITSLLSNTTKRHELSEGATKQAGKYSVAHFIDQILTLYKDITS